MLNINKDEQNQNELSEIECNILEKMFNTSNKDITVSFLCSEFSKIENLIQYHIDELISRNLIRPSNVIGGMTFISVGGNDNSETSYSLTKEGRKYVVENILK